MEEILVSVWVSNVMEERGVKVIKISELVHRSRPLTGASSVTRRRSDPQPSDRNHKPIPPNQNPNPNPNPKILSSLNHPTIIIGTLTLPSPKTPSTPNSTLRCPKTSCFSFSDGSASVCCDILDLDARIIGREVHILAWNFIPLKCGGGFLEIINWELPETSGELSFSSDGFPLVSDCSTDCKDTYKALYSVKGALESVSPTSVVPCVVNSSVSRNVCGFLVQIVVCECKLCRRKDSVMALQDQPEGQNRHCFTKPLIVYFCGSASLWHPVITKLIGSVVLLSGLKKKLVFIGQEESQLMYVTTEKAMLHLPKVFERWLPVSETVIEGKGECSMYTGTVTGVYMQGMVVELDKKVLLLLTDQLLAPPHSLRVGAIVSMRNVHFVNPNFCWTKILVLGACYKTSISVKSFSPYETGCCLHSQSPSLLGKFINSLSFSVRLWVLLLVSSFRKKFAGILTEKEILGSKHKEGLAQSYATSHLPSSVFRSRHGVFREYCKHDSCGCGNEPNYCQLKLVVPISHFISHCEATWMKMLLELKTDSDLMYNYENSSLSCEGLSHSRSIRNILHSEDIGVILLGSVKIASYSGRLQLIDATGSIDVIIPDLPSTWNIDSIYEVNNFALVMEGIPEEVNFSWLHLNESFLCRNIFSSIPLRRDMKLAIYLLYHIRDKKIRNHPFHFCIKNKENFGELQSGRFHLLLVTHKYPVQQKDEQVVSNSSSMFAEVLILPWDLFLAGKNGCKCPSKVSKEYVEHHYTSTNYQECVPGKRYKIDRASNRDLRSGLAGAGYGLGGLANCCSTTRSFQEQKCPSLSSPAEIPCFVTSNDGCLASSGILCCSKAKSKVGSCYKPSAREILLEFKSESFCKYELLRIGGHYMVKQHKEIIDVSCDKVIMTSRTHLRSLSFSFDDILPNTNLSHFPINPSSSTNEALSECPSHNERPLLRLNVECPVIHSDLYVHLPSDVASFLKEELKVSDAGMFKPCVSLKEASLCNESIMTGSVQSSGTSHPEFQLPEGNLISFHGHVLAVHNSGCSSFAVTQRHKSPIDVKWAKFFQVTNTVCIHVLVDHRMVRVVGALSKHSLPIGFGSGIDATFHRILVSSGQNELILTPTSFIVVKSIRVGSDQCIDKYGDLFAASGPCNIASLETLPSVLITEIMQHADCKPVQFHCRVVAIYILVLESNRKAVHPKSKLSSKSHVVNIPLAGFVLDDGSSSCCCWTNSDKAATLLRLQEEVSHENNTARRGSKKIRVDDARGPTVHQLDQILKKHGRVIVKNYGSMFDSLGQDLTFSVTSNSVISSSDEDILKFVILNACFSTFSTVVGSLMDSNATGQLERLLMEMDMTMHPMQNIWVREVHYTNPLTEARKIVQELLNQ